MRSLLRRVLCPPILDELPKQFGTPLFPCTPIGPYQRVNKAKAAGFPDDFYVAVAKIANVAPMAIGWGLLVGKGIGVTHWWESCMGERVLKIAPLPTSDVLSILPGMRLRPIPGSQEGHES